jgi:hypothetical protein
LEVDQATPTNARACVAGILTRILRATQMWSILKEFLAFLRQEKKWWIIPIVLILVALGALLVFSAGSPLAPFIYSLF